MFARTQARYEQLLTDAPERVRGVDASGTPDAVVDLAWTATADLLEPAATSG